MNFSSFKKSLNQTLIGESIKIQSVFGSDLIQIGESGQIYINYKKTDLSSIEEAKERINRESLDHSTNRQLVINAINSYDSSIRITEDLIDEYSRLAESNLYTIDPIIMEVKSSSVNFLNKYEFSLNDGSIIAIDEDTQTRLMSTINKYEIVDYMRESKENFMRVVEQIIEE